MGFVLSMNLSRRHLNESQRAAVAVKLANMPQGKRTDLEPSANLRIVSQPQAAEMLNVSERTIQAFKEVTRKCDPDVIAAIESGRLTIHAALKDKKIEERAVKIEEQRAAIMDGVIAKPDGLFDVLVIDPAQKF